MVQHVACLLDISTRVCADIESQLDSSKIPFIIKNLLLYCYIIGIIYSYIIMTKDKPLAGITFHLPAIVQRG